MRAKKVTLSLCSKRVINHLKERHHNYNVCHYTGIHLYPLANSKWILIPVFPIPQPQTLFLFAPNPSHTPHVPNHFSSCLYIYIYLTSPLPCGMFFPPQPNPLTLPRKVPFYTIILVCPIFQCIRMEDPIKWWSIQQYYHVLVGFQIQRYGSGSG